MFLYDGEGNGVLCVCVCVFFCIGEGGLFEKGGGAMDNEVP